MTELTPPDIVLRSPSADELRAFMEPLIPAFGSGIDEGEFEAERSLLEPDRLVSAFVGDDRVGGAGAFTMRMTVPGGEIPVSAVTAVGVRPDHTRRGILRRMMDWLFADAIRRGEPVAVLWASEAAIYQRFGYGSATQRCYFEVDRSRVVFRSPLPPRDGVAFRLVDVEELYQVGSRLYDRTRTIVPGTLERSEARWRNLILSDAEWMRRGAGPTFRVVLDIDGEPRGYALYRIKGDWSPRGSRNALDVVEVVALDAEAEQRLWQWLFRIDLVTTIVGLRGPHPHPMQQWVVEPRLLGLTISDGLWLRVLDVPAALAARTYATERSIVLKIEDGLIESNAARWQLTAAADGSARVVRTEADPDLALDIATLACAYLGAHRFSDLARAGRVRELRQGAVVTADLLFMPPRAPYSNTFF
jgi:predicted acetyltransferase